jgi:hypothetical protein
VIETHAAEGAVELGGGVLARPVLPPQLVAHRHSIPIPPGAAEQLTEDDLRPPGGQRRGPGLVVVAGVVEQGHAGLLGGSHDAQPVVAGDALERAHEPSDMTDTAGPVAPSERRGSIRRSSQPRP